MKSKSMLLCIAVALLAAPAANAVDYWPIGDGMILNFDNGSILSTALGANAQTAWYHENRGGAITSVCYTAPSDGDVYVVGGATPGVNGPVPWTLPTRFKFLDLPLYPTKTWSIVYGAEDGDKAPAAWVRGRCNEAGTLVTAWGNLYFYEVTVTGIHPTVDGTYWVNDTYGPVRLPSGARLTEIAHPMPDEPQAWGSVKALFR